jgi:hypothetical protein
MIRDVNPVRSKRVTDALLSMAKLDIAELEKAYRVVCPGAVDHAGLDNSAIRCGYTESAAPVGFKAGPGPAGS